MIDLIYFEQRPLAEVAEILNWKLSKVKVRSMRAKQKLRKQLKIMMDKE
jgi:DNA-directed RNA polymerase specialized sigma24 family protein